MADASVQRPPLTIAPIALAFLAPVLLALALGWLAAALLQQTALINHTSEVLAALSRVDAELVTAQGSARAFLLAGTDDLLAPYRSARAALDDELPALAAALAGSPAQRARVAALHDRYQEWQRRIERQIAERRMVTTAADVATASFRATEPDAVRAVIAEIAGAEAALREEQQAWADRAWWRTGLVGTGAALLCGLLLAYVWRRQLAAGAQRQASSEAARQRHDVEARAGIECAAVAMAQIDPVTHRFLSANPVMTELTGYGERELLAMHFLDISHADDRAVDIERFRRFAAGELTHAGAEMRCVRKDGSVRWVHAATSLIPASGDQPPRLVALLSEITDRKRAEEALRESEARARRILEHLPQLIWTCRASGDCDCVGPQWAAYTGRRDAELLGDGWLEGVHIEDRDEVARAWRRSVATGDPFAAVYRLRRRDGEYAWWDGRAVAVRDAAGRIQGWVASSWDVDAAKREADDARAAAAAAEHEVEERTMRLDAAARELDAFTYAVSHDLRSPLRRLDAFAELLGKALGDGRSEMVEHYARRIGAEAQRAGELIDGLLAFLRTGRVALRVQPVDSAELLTAARDELTGGNGRAIAWEIEPLAAVVADPTLLRIVFTQLLSNALKFTAGRAEARIGVHCRRGDGETIFSVTDNGVGFDMRFAGQLFGLFQRLHLAEEFDGNGIGLAIAHRIVTRHGGRMWAEAEAGSGATFAFALPDRPTSEWSLDAAPSLEAQRAS